MATKKASNRPSHYIYAVSKRGESDKGFWTRIGAAWANSDGKGWNISLDLMPTNGADIVMRDPKDDAEGAPE